MPIIIRLTANRINYSISSYVIDATNGAGGADGGGGDNDNDADCPTKPHLKSRSNSEENIVFDISKEMLKNG